MRPAEQGGESGARPAVATRTQALTEATLPSDTIVKSDIDSASGYTPGAFPGDLAVTPDGEALYHFELWSPPGRAGMAPALGLTYRSRAGTGFLGMGWSLDGLELISRCSATVAQDSRSGGINFGQLATIPMATPQDWFCLNGHRLIAVRGAYASDGTVYATEVDDFSRIISHGTDVRGPIWFEVRTRSGLIMEFRKTVEGLSGSTLVRAQWLLSKVADRAGNYFSVSYLDSPEFHSGTFYETVPSAITYTNFGSTTGTKRVDFVWGAKAETTTYFVSGLPFISRKRLEAIRMIGPSPSSVAAVLREYRFGYRDTRPTTSITGRTQLASVQDCSYEADGTRVCKAPTTFKYEIGSNAFEKVYLNQVDPSLNDVLTSVDGSGGFTSNSMQVGDINGDGFPDLLYRRTRVSTRYPGIYEGVYYLRLNRGSYVTGQPVFGAPIAVALPVIPESSDPAMLMDVNGDGLTDVITTNGVPSDFINKVNRRFQVWLSAGANFYFSTELPYEDNQFLPTPPFISLGDMDGDGRPDLLVFVKSVIPGETWDIIYHRNLYGEGGTFGPGVKTTGVLLESMYLVDLYRTGRIGILAVPKDETKLSNYVYLDPTGKLQVKIVNLSGSYKDGYCFFPKDDSMWIVDYNGDGLPDRLRSIYRIYGVDTPTPTQFQQTTVELNTGNGFMPPFAVSDRCEAQSSFFGLPASGTADLNQDGLSDILSYDWPDENSDPVLTTGFATGAFSNGYLYDTTTEVLWNVSTNSWVDIDGDGQLDMLSKARLAPITNRRQWAPDTIYLRHRIGRPPDALTTIIDGTGAATQISYRPASDRSVVGATRICSFPQACVNGQLWVVSQVSADSGNDLAFGYPASQRVFTYHYDNGVADLTGRGLLGFEKRTVTDVTAGTTTVEEYDLTTTVTANGSQTRDASAPRNLRVYPYARTASKTTTTGPGFRSTVEVYPTTVADSTFGIPYSTYASRVRLTEEELSGASWVALRTVTTDQVVNAVGSLSSRKITTGELVVGQETYSYADDLEPTRWMVGRPTLLVASETTPAGKTATRTTAWTWNAATGLLDSETIEPNSTDRTLNMRRTFGRTDALGPGLVTSITDSAVDPLTGAASTRTETFTYDSIDHQYVAFQTNALGHTTSRAYLRGLGIDALEIDPNGVKHARQYDVFGRPKGMTTSGSASASISAKQSVKYRIVPGGHLAVDVVSTGEGSGTIEYDRFGRVVAQSALVDGRTTVKRWQYDARGLLVSESSPSFLGDPTVYITGYEYDSRQRLATIRKGTVTGGTGTCGTAGISCVTFSYSGLSVTRTDELLNKTVRKIDQSGRVISASDLVPAGTLGAARTLSTTYAYGPFGVLESRTDAVGNTSTMTWDVRGRRQTLKRPGLTGESTIHNAFGEIVRTTSDDGSVITTARDALGRPATVTTPEGVTTYSWDTAAHGLGALASATSGDSVTVAYAYDALGRVIDTSWGIAGSTYHLSRDFDPATGLLRTLTYPTVAGQSVQIAYQYGADGSMTGVQQVLSATNMKPLWLLDSHDASGRTRTATYGRTLQVQTQFDALNQIRVMSASNSGTPVQNLVYEYGVDGNVRAKHDLVLKVSELFTYDPLDRLATWTVSQNCAPTLAVSFRYDDGGNLLQRQVSSGSEASKSFTYGGTVPPYALATSPSGTYGYDALGRQKSAPGRTVTYTSSDLPRQITAGTRNVIFKYGPFGERAFKDSSDGTKVTYVGGVYERRATLTGTQHVFAVGNEEGIFAEIAWDEASGVVTGTHTRYLLRDRNGSVDTIVDESGSIDHQKFEPFGEKRSPTDLGRQATATPVTLDGFTGHVSDADLGLIDMQGRIYDPSLASFLTPDPASETSPRVHSQGFNAYGYVARNPMRWTDASGFGPEDDDAAANAETRRQFVEDMREQSRRAGMEGYQAVNTRYRQSTQDPNSALQRETQRETVREMRERARNSGSGFKRFFTGLAGGIGRSLPGLAIGAAALAVTGPAALAVFAASYAVYTLAKQGPGAAFDTLVPIRPLIASSKALAAAIHSGDWEGAGTHTTEVLLSGAGVVGVGFAMTKFAKLHALGETAETAGLRSAVQERVGRLKAEIDAIAKNPDLPPGYKQLPDRITMAAAVAENNAGVRKMVIASNEIRNTPRPGITIGENEIWIPGRGKMHAERRLTEWENSAEAQAEGWRLLEGVGATRDQCIGCVVRLRLSGLKSFTPMKKYGLKFLFPDD